MLNFEKVEIHLGECSEFPLDLIFPKTKKIESYVWNHQTKKFDKQTKKQLRNFSVWVPHLYMSPDDCIECYLQAKKLLKQFKKPKPFQLVNPILNYFDYQENGFGMLGLERK